MFGIPFELISDNGSNFTSEVVEILCAIFQIKNIHISVRNPRANWIERQHRVMKTFLTALCAMRKQPGYECRQWDICLPQVQYCMNSQPKEPQKISALEYLLGMPPCSQIRR